MSDHRSLSPVSQDDFSSAAETSGPQAKSIENRTALPNWNTAGDCPASGAMCCASHVRNVED